MVARIRHEGVEGTGTGAGAVSVRGLGPGLGLGLSGWAIGGRIGRSTGGLRSGEEERLRLIDQMTLEGWTPRPWGPAGKKVAKLLPMLSSDNDGEALSAARAIGRTLQSAGLSWQDLSATFDGDKQL